MEDKVEVQDVGVRVFKTGKEAARLIAFLEGLKIAEPHYWMNQPVAAFSGLGEAIKLKVQTMEKEVERLEMLVKSLNKDLENARAVQPPQEAGNASS